MVESISRRSFIGATVATGLAVSGYSLAHAAPAGQFIDAHVHVWTPELQRFPLAAGFKASDMVPASFTPEELFRHAKPVGVNRVVLIQMSFYRFDNSYMLSVMEAQPDVFRGVAILDDQQSDTPQRMRELHARGVRGFRLYTDRVKAEAWQDSPGIKAMWSTAAETGQAMCLLANPDALPAVTRMCQQFPRTRVVIDHFARIGMTGSIEPSDLENLCRLAKFENVFVKTSAFYALGTKRPPYKDLIPMIQRLLAEFGAGRLMWASDCPYQVQAEHTYAASIELIQQHVPNLSVTDRQQLLQGTAERVFFS